MIKSDSNMRPTLKIFVFAENLYHPGTWTQNCSSTFTKNKEGTIIRTLTYGCDVSNFRRPAEQ